MNYSFDESTVSDLHKDTYGFRPCQGFWAEWRSSTDDQKQVIWDQLVAALDIELQESIAAEKQAIAEFEATVTRTIAMGAGDRATAIRWIVEGSADIDRLYPGDYLCWQMRLPYSYAKEFNPVINAMAAKAA
jgi:hypothetical protein